jgi:hypothetical protein
MASSTSFDEEDLGFCGSQSEAEADEEEMMKQRRRAPLEEQAAVLTGTRTTWMISQVLRTAAKVTRVKI